MRTYAQPQHTHTHTVLMPEGTAVGLVDSLTCRNPRVAFVSDARPVGSPIRFSGKRGVGWLSSEEQFPIPRALASRQSRCDAIPPQALVEQQTAAARIHFIELSAHSD